MNFQGGVEAWMGECFPPNIVHDHTERGDRLLEEVLELLQSHGYDRSRVTTLVDYVYGRPVGEPAQEVGGVMVTLAAYCMIAGLNMHDEGDRELSRITQPDVMAKIRRKQEAKRALHFDTPLPGHAATQPEARGVEVAEGLCDLVRGARFGHHPDPAIDFCIEVESLEARMFDARHGIGKPGEQPESVESVREAIERALQFRVGGDLNAIAAKTTLRALATPNPVRAEGAWDQKALEVAQRIALMWGHDRSQFVSKIQVAVTEAMQWAAPAAPAVGVDAEALAQEWLKYARDLRGDGCYSCCAGTYEHCAAHLKALFGKCPHPGCKFTDGKPCAYAHCPQQGSIESTSR